MCLTDICAVQGMQLGVAPSRHGSEAYVGKAHFLLDTQRGNNSKSPSRGAQETPRLSEHVSDQASDRFRESSCGIMSLN